MKQITEQEFYSLKQLIYEKIMESPELGPGEMGEANDEAERIIKEWMEANNIELI
jgi:hypothetical protein